MKEKILKQYQLGLWTDKMILQAAEKTVLTEEEAKQILEGEA